MFSSLEVVRRGEGQEDGGHEKAEVPPEGGGHLRPQEGRQASELQGESQRSLRSPLTLFRAAIKKCLEWRL